MDHADIEKLCRLLAGSYPAPAKKIQTDDYKLALFYALEPYAYRDVRAAALAHIRECGFYPDIAEITRRLPALEKSGKYEIAKSFLDAARIARTRTDDQWRALGVLPLPEAVGAMGISPQMWAKEAKERLEK